MIGVALLNTASPIMTQTRHQTPGGSISLVSAYCPASSHCRTRSGQLRRWAKHCRGSAYARSKDSGSAHSEPESLEQTLGKFYKPDFGEVRQTRPLGKLAKPDFGEVRQTRPLGKLAKPDFGEVRQTRPLGKLAKPDFGEVRQTRPLRKLAKPDFGEVRQTRPLGKLAKPDFGEVRQTRPLRKLAKPDFGEVRQTRPLRKLAKPDFDKSAKVELWEVRQIGLSKKSTNYIFSPLSLDSKTAAPVKGSRP